MIHQVHFWVFILKNMKTLAQKDICAPMFTVPLFMIADIWKQPTCLLIVNG